MALLRKGGMAAHSRVKGLLIVVAAGLAGRLLVTAVFPATGGLKRLEPSVVAGNLNAGRGFTFDQYGAVYHAWKEPMFIVFLAWVMRRWPQDGAMLLIQGFFGIAAACLVWLLAEFLTHDAIKAASAGVIAAINPFLLYYDTHAIHPLSMDCFLFMAAVGCLLLARKDGPGWALRSACAGLVTGLALWQRASIFAAVFAGWLAAVICARQGQRRKALLGAAIWLAVACAVITPWLARNYRLFGRVVLTTDAAHIFWLGNNPWSNGTYSDAAGKRVINLADDAFQREIAGAPEIVQFDRFRDATRRFIFEHPGRFASLTASRAWSFIWFSPNAGLDYTPGQSALYRMAYAALFFLGLAGIRQCWRESGQDDRAAMIVLLSAVGGLWAVHAVSAVNLKHRAPLELIWAIFAAAFLVRAFRFVFHGKEA